MTDRPSTVRIPVGFNLLFLLSAFKLPAFPIFKESMLNMLKS